MEQPPAQDAGQPAVTVPSCYRHPGRETYLSCTRCGRPACPDCLRSAPVGQQCVECIREGSQGARAPRTLFGGRIGSGAPVTWTLVAINVVLYLTEWVYPPVVHYLELVGNGFDPALNQQVGVAHGEAYRLLTSAFLHEPGLSGFGPAHIIFNMWALIVVGPALERLLGAARYLAVYLLSALGGAVLFYLLAPVNEPALGASGAIFGLFGAWFVASRRLRVDSRGIVFLIVINLVITFAASSVIAWQDHVGGLITGGLLMAAYAYAPRQQRRLVQVGATAVVIAVLVIAVLARDSRLASAALSQGAT
ncbi:MAG: rhomboid family intramembrane serine protease [Nocardiopsaceae bacterium]|nr:rhomboid family intramembrane serine protease [Nocardiopsaceae bacterium]